MKNMKVVWSIVGVIAIAWVGYYFLITVPARKQCIANATEIYTQADNNLNEGLINDQTLQAANDQMLAAEARCEQ
jgi:hypothetical protein